jgi:hypothetical protein
MQYASQGVDRRGWGYGGGASGVAAPGSRVKGIWNYAAK